MVTRANFNLIGVVLPPGTRDVQLRFIDTAYETGKTITLIAIGLALMATVAGVVARRRLATAP
jgi:LPXTG-motif cell wall-anchored protein